MSQFTTYLNAQDVAVITRLGARAIQDFLRYLKDPQSPGMYAGVPVDAEDLRQWRQDFSMSLRAFEQNPDAFSAEALCAIGADHREAIKHFIRMEVRDPSPDGRASQIAIKGVAGVCRRIALEYFTEDPYYQCRDFIARSAGRTTLEFNAPEVDKALPIRYLRHRWDALMDEMNYQPGPLIDARQTGTVIAADGDGTTYVKPTQMEAPNVRTSPLYQDWKTYLAAGGIYMIVSGNDLDRTLSRMSGAFDPVESSRLIIVTSGGANMALLDASGHKRLVTDYLDHAVELGRQPSERQLDMIYIGDDHKLYGNDLPAFQEVGFERSFLVNHERPEGEEFRSIRFIPGYENGTHKILQSVLRFVHESPRSEVFTEDHIDQIEKGAE